MCENVKERKDVIVKVETQKLTASLHNLALRLERKSKERVRNKPVFEEEEYSDSRRTSIVSKERTEQNTKVYHEGKILKEGRLINHPKHLKSSKKHKNE